VTWVDGGAASWHGALIGRAWWADPEQFAAEDGGQPLLPVGWAPAQLRGEQLVAMAVDQGEEGGDCVVAVTAGSQWASAYDHVNQGLLSEVAALVVFPQQLPHGGIAGGGVAHHFLDRGRARRYLGGVLDHQGEPLPRVSMLAGLLDPVTVEQGSWPGVTGDGHIEDAAEDRLPGPERLVDGCW
jgi:hypothetical protein